MPFTLQTWLAFLIGRRDAILAAAATPGALGLGAVLVLSAALARQYDGDDLMAKPWHLLGPFAASLVTSFAIYCVVHLAMLRKEIARPRFWPSYARFLTLYWLTAPLAWLYGIPWERIFSAEGAAAMNLWTLAVVAVWRFALIVRCVSVLLGCRFAGGVLVALSCDAIALAALTRSESRVLVAMGGLRLDPHEAALGTLVLFGTLFTLVTLPVWLIGALAVILQKHGDWSPPSFGDRPRRLGADEAFGTPIISRRTWTAAGCAVAFWAAFLPFTQPEQANRRAVESLFRAGRHAEAVAYMSARSQNDFPPHWSPPPILGRPDWEHDLIRATRVVVDRRPADWVRATYARKFIAALHDMLFLSELKDDELAIVLRLTRECPEVCEFLRSQPRYFQHGITRDPEKNLSGNRMQVFDAIADVAGIPSVERLLGLPSAEPGSTPESSASPMPQP